MLSNALTSEVATIISPVYLSSFEDHVSSSSAIYRHNIKLSLSASRNTQRHQHLHVPDEYLVQSDQQGVHQLHIFNAINGLIRREVCKDIHCPAHPTVIILLLPQSQC